jgi:hypothetical protein
MVAGYLFSVMSSDGFGFCPAEGSNLECQIS